MSNESIPQANNSSVNVKKETVDIDILITSRNNDKKSCKLLEKGVDLSHVLGAEPVEPVRMNIYQNDTYRRDLSWLQIEMSQGFDRGSK